MSAVLSPRIKFGTIRKQVATLRERRLYIGHRCVLNDVDTENSLTLTQTKPKSSSYSISILPTFFLRLCQ